MGMVALAAFKEEVVKAAIHWAVRAFVREIREAVGNVRRVDWVVM
jgi:hypothetical protein